MPPQKRTKGRGRSAPRSRTTAWREIALLLVIAIVAVFVLVFDPAMRDVFDLPKAAFTHAIAWVLLAVLVLVALSDGLAIPRSPLFVAFYALVAVEVVTTVTATDPYVATYGEVGRYLGLTTHVVLALVAVAIAVAMDYPRRAPWLAWAIGALVVVTGGYAVMQLFGRDPVHWTDLDPRARPFSSFGNPDFYGQFLAVVIVACGAFIAFRARHARLAIIAGVAAVAAFALVLMVLVQTRGSALGIVAGALALSVLWLRRAGLSRPVLLRFALGAGTFAVAVALVLAATPLGGRLVDITRGVGLRDRVLLYESATRMFLDHALVGVGFENFAVIYPRYQQPEWFTIAGANSTNTSAHNWILHTAATMGVLGLVATFALILMTFVMAWRRARDADATALLVAAVALAAYYGSGVVLPGAQSIQWIPWACFGVALASDVRTAPSLVRLGPFRTPAVARFAAAVVIAGLALTEVGVLRANELAKTAEVALGDPVVARAVNAARGATSTDPGRAVYWNDLGRALERASDNAGARAAYVEATTRSPYTPAFWWNLARMQAYFAQNGDPTARDDAYASMRRALAASPENPETLDRFARMQVTFADYAGALANERHAILSAPANVAYYQVASDAAAKLGDSAASVDILREGIRATDANALRVVLARALISSGAIVEARTVLSEALRKDPNDVAASSLQGELAGR